MAKPPAAVEIVIEALMMLLTGRALSLQESRRILGGGDAFLLLLRNFEIGQITDARLRLLEPYVDNPVFRPSNVAPASACAAKFCAWIVAVVQVRSLILL